MNDSGGRERVGERASDGASRCASVQRSNNHATTSELRHGAEPTARSFAGCSPPSQPPSPTSPLTPAPFLLPATPAFGARTHPPALHKGPALLGRATCRRRRWVPRARECPAAVGGRYLRVSPLVDQENPSNNSSDAAITRASTT